MKFPGSTAQRQACLIAALATSLVSISVQADDIDVYKQGIDAQQKPNILFVLDYSGSMAWDTSGNSYSTGNGPSRISVLKSAMNQILDNNVESINAGLGSLYSSTTTGIRWPVSDLSADANSLDPNIPAGTYTVRDIIKQRLDERGAAGSTATVDALVEAAQYFRGDPVTHNDSPTWNSNRHRPATWDTNRRDYRGGDADAALPISYSPSNAYTRWVRSQDTYYCNDYTGSGGPNFCEGKDDVNRCSVITADAATTPGFERLNNLWGSYRRCEYDRDDRWETPRYNSPVTDTCDAQTNAIVLITDGEPTAINRGASLRSLVPGNDIGACEDLSPLFASSRWTDTEGNCAIEVARTMAGTTPGTLSSVSAIPFLPGGTVKTYTVGFNINDAGQVFLNRLAEAGDGRAFNAQSPEQLSTALTEIVEDIKSGSENFSQLSVEVDKASYSHDDRVYYSLFSPSKKRAWQGNLKGYFVESGGLVDINGEVAEIDNVFTRESQSFWSPEADGDKVEVGGASGKLANATRKLYTYFGDELVNGPVPLAGPNRNRLQSGNTAITNDMLGLGNTAADTTLRNDALDWIENAPMGDPLHTKSVGVNYGDMQVRYTMTNQGLLHAFDATNPTTKAFGNDDPDTSGGDELFAFMPKRLLRNLPDLYINTSGEGHIYGLDGAITRWHDDTDNDGVVDDGEDVTLYFGMRRGGSAYYAMDVRNPYAPKLKWVIDENSAGFDRLAQSWSRMSLVRVMAGTGERRVLVFGGGYDAEAQDDVNAPVASKGNAIYMVAENGELLRTIDKSDHERMEYSIASDLTIIDTNNDQFADRIYVGDLGGQVWRIDFDNITATTPVVTRMAALADNSHQPFFYPPSVSLNGNRGDRFLSVTIGSGNRTNPLLEGVTNNFYMLRDTDVKKGAPASSPYSTITANDLHDATDNDIQSGTASNVEAAKNDLKNKRGWRIKLEPGEKSLSSILTYDGKLMATTFIPGTAADGGACGTPSKNLYYVMDVVDASVVNPLDDDTTTNSDDNGSSQDTGIPKTARHREIKNRAIASGPKAVHTKNDSTGQIFVDREVVDTFARSISQVYWHAR